MEIPETEIIVRKHGAEILRKTVRPGDYVIGRDAECDLRVEAEQVSPRHAQLVVNFDHALVEDLGSEAGTFVNGQRVSDSTRLWPNQKIQIGAATVELHRMKTAPPPGVSLAPQTAAVQKLLPEEWLRDRKYEIGNVIARGGMGAILEAKEATIERRVAMKVMLDGSSPDDVARFVAEAKITGQLEHPCIIPVYELSVDENGQVFYTMKMVRGITFKKVLEELAKGTSETVKKYPLPVLLTIFQKVCDAVAFAHSRGVIHRDLKPENIMVGEFGEVSVMDWGLAKVIGQEPIPAQQVSRSAVRTLPPESGGGTVAGAVMGTPEYMSPEQARGEVENLDLRSDIYALGAILYYILALRPSVVGNDAWTIVAKVSEGAIEPLVALKNRTISDSLAAVVRKAMAFERDDRYLSVADLQRDVTAYQSGFATRAEQASLVKQILLLVQRNKGVFVTALVAWLVITALVGGFVISLTASERRATRNAEIATENGQRATRNAELAAKKAEEAKAEAGRATKAEKVATEKEEATRRALALSQIALAEAAYREQDSFAVQAALDLVPEDLRDSNWNYLLAKSDTSLNSLHTLYTPVQAAPHPTKSGVFAMVTRIDNRVLLVEARTGAILLKFQPGYSEKSTSSEYRIAFSPDGESLAIGRHGSGGIVIHSTRDGKKLMTLETADTESLQFSPDGRQLLEVSEDKQITLWDAAAGKRLWSKPGGARLKALFDSSGQAILCYSEREKLSLLNARDGSLLRELPGPAQASVVSMAVYPNGKLALTGDALGFVRCLDLSNGAVQFQIRANNQPIRCLACTPDGSRFVTLANLAGSRQSVQVWDAGTGSLLEPLLGGRGASPFIAVHPLSGELVVCGAVTKVWDLAKGAEKWTIPVTLSDYATIAFWGQDELFTRRGAENAMQLLSLSSGVLSTIWKADRKADRMVSVSTDGKFAVISTASSANPSSMRLLHKVGDSVEAAPGFEWNGFTHLLRLSPVGDKLFVAGRYPECVYDPATGKELARFNKEGLDQTYDVCWNGNTQLIAAVTTGAHYGLPGSEEQLILFDATTGARLKTLTLRTRASCLGVSPAGKIFAEAGTDRMVRLRDSATLELKNEFRGHDAPITVLAWHPTKPILATASEDLTIKLWNTETARCLAELRGPFAAPASLTFSPSGKSLACLSHDNTVRIWEPEVLNPDASAGVPADGWEDLFSRLNPADVEKHGDGWKLNNGTLLSPKKGFAAVPLAGNFSDASYQVRVKLRQLEPQDAFSVILPVADRQTSFMLDGYLNNNWASSLNQINGANGKGNSATVQGKVVKDSDQHVLEITVRLKKSDLRIEVSFDDQLLYQWSGPVTALGLNERWEGIPRGSLALGSHKADWVVYEAKVKRLEDK